MAQSSCPKKLKAHDKMWGTCTFGPALDSAMQSFQQMQWLYREVLKVVVLCGIGGAAEGTSGSPLLSSLSVVAFFFI